MPRRALLALILVSLFSVFLIGAGTAQAYPQFSNNKDATNCRACHGDFRDSPYISLTEGADWGKSLMAMHKDDILDGDCDTCHNQGANFPVNIGSSKGGTGLDPIACAGCHGRAEDGTGTGSEGYGAGLRQHHWVANRTIGVDPPGCDPDAPPGHVDECTIVESTRVCGTCHERTDLGGLTDADPANFTPVDEIFLPPYYADPAGSDLNHLDIPSDPCNPGGAGEDYAGTTEGLDNDGDGLYDENDWKFDANNQPIGCPEPGQLAILLPGIGALLLIDRRRQRSQVR